MFLHLFRSLISFIIFHHTDCVHILLNLHPSISSIMGGNCKWYCVFILFPFFSLLLHINAIDFCMLILYSVTLLLITILIIFLRNSSWRFFCRFCGIFYVYNHVTCNRNSFFFSFQIYMLLIFMLYCSGGNRSSENGYPWFCFFF